jgi:cobaltochelatase CobT
MVTRGVGDSMALRTACHNPGIHARSAPEGADARAIYDAVEQARIEAIGARRMQGVGDNIAAMIDDRFVRNNLAAVTEQDQAPLPEAVALIVREKLTGRPTPPGAAAVADLWRDWIEDKAGDDFASLETAIDDQSAFAKAVRDMLVSMELADEMSGEEPEAEDDNDEEEPESEEESEGGSEDESGEEQSETEESQAESEQPESGEMDAADATSEDMDEDMDADTEEPGEAIRPDQPVHRHPVRHRLQHLHHRVRRDGGRRGTLRRGGTGPPARLSSTSSSPISRAWSAASPTGCSAA